MIKVITRNIVFAIACIGTLVLLVSAGRFYFLYIDEAGRDDFAGVGFFAAWLVGGIGLTALGVMTITFVTRFRNGDEIGSLISSVGSGGLFALLAGLVTWLLAIIGLETVDNDSVFSFMIHPVGFLIFAALQMLLYLKFLQWCARLSSRISERRAAKDDANTSE
ncbi:MAG: hypothetical protein ACYC0V_19110 [Armatimonadota bacterium]